PLGSLVPSGEQFTEWVASVREIYDSGDKTAATDISLAGVYGQDYRRFTDGALPAGAFDRAVSDIDTFFQVELGAVQRWNITTEGLKDIRHPVLSMRGSDTLPVFFEVADLLQQWIPEIDTVSIPCASHDLPGRNPVAVASGLVEFFTKGAEQDKTVEKKVQQLRQPYADAPQYAKTALENTLGELTSQASKPRSRMESAGRTGSRQGKVSELTMIAPFAPGGAARLRALLQLRDGSGMDPDRVGTVHDMRFVFLDNDTKLLFSTAYDGEWDPYIDDFATKITDQMDVLFSACEGWPGIRSPQV